MKIILYGSEGTIGTEVKNLLLKKKADIYLVENKKKIKLHKKYKIVKNNFFNKKNFIKENDILIYLAWGSLNDFNSKLHTNRELHRHYFNIKRLIENGLKNIIISGTCLEYKKTIGSLSEKSEVYPVTKYGIAKNKLRIKLEGLKKKYKINLSWLRIFYIYGNSNNNNNLWSKIINFSSKNKTKDFNMSSGEQFRDYIHVKDLAKLIIIISLKKKNYGIINVCSGKPVQIKELVKKWKLKYKLNINFKFNRLAMPSYESIKFWGNNKKLKNILKK